MTNSAARTESDPPLAEPVVRVIGHIKWFDSVKGYGFIVAESTSDAALTGDVMIHISCLRDYGETFADEGAKIVCDAARRPRGWQTVHIIEMERPRAAVARERGDRPDFEEVTLKWFNKARGYGFVRRSTDEIDIFVHAVALRKAGYEDVEPGTLIEVVIETGAKGDHVLSVRSRR
ncbi:MAG: cold-shock protein [Hyphomonas sp.]